MRQRSMISPQIILTAGPNRTYTDINPPGGTVQYPFQPFRYTPQYGRIIDSEGSRWSGAVHGRLGFKPCQHVRWDVAWKPYLTAPIYYNYSSSKYHGQLTNGSTGGRICEMYAYTYYVPIDYEMDLGDWCAGIVAAYIPSYGHTYYDRWKKVAPTMATRASMAVSLFELGDIHRMFQVIPGKHFKFSSWREVLRYANGQHLNYNFGWKPFVNDVKHVFRALNSFETRLQRFVTDRDSDLRRRAGSPNAENTIVRSLFRSSYGMDVRFTGKYTQWANSTFDYRYSIPEYGNGEMRTRAYLDSLGLVVSPATIWECIPWSFAVDWFTDIGGYLQSHQSDWIEPYVDFIQACDCSTVDCEGTWALKDTEGPDNVYEDFAVMHYHAFTRSLGIPKWSPSTDLDADKIRLLSSLAIGRVI